MVSIIAVPGVLYYYSQAIIGKLEKGVQIDELNEHNQFLA